MAGVPLPFRRDHAEPRTHAHPGTAAAHPALRSARRGGGHPAHDPAHQAAAGLPPRGPADARQPRFAPRNLFRPLRLQRETLRRLALPVHADAGRCGLQSRARLVPQRGVHGRAGTRLRLSGRPLPARHL